VHSHSLKFAVFVLLKLGLRLPVKIRQEGNPRMQIAWKNLSIASLNGSFRKGQVSRALKFTVSLMGLEKHANSPSLFCWDYINRNGGGGAVFSICSSTARFLLHAKGTVSLHYSEAARLHFASKFNSIMPG